MRFSLLIFLVLSSRAFVVITAHSALGSFLRRGLYQVAARKEQQQDGGNPCPQHADDKNNVFNPTVIEGGAAANDDTAPSTTTNTTNGTATTPAAMASTTTTTTAVTPNDPAVFWGVNGVIIFSLAAVTAWFCCCGGAKRIMEATNRVASDEQYRQRLAERQIAAAQLQEKRQMTPAQKKQKLAESFQRNQVTMVVKESDLNLLEEGNSASLFPPVEEGHGEPDLDDATNCDDRGTLTLHQAGQPDWTVPNLCIICLGPYSVNETVVWSSNPNCRHAFHEDCLLDWLVHSSSTNQSTTHTDHSNSQEGVTPCPCCRQSFTDLKNFRKERKIRWNPDHAFNPSIIRF